MQTINDLSNKPCYYGYSQNGQILIIPPRTSRYFEFSKKFVQSLADISKTDKFLYSINNYGEIYFTRKIVSVYNKCLEVSK